VYDDPDSDLSETPSAAVEYNLAVAQEGAQHNDSSSQSEGASVVLPTRDQVGDSIVNSSTTDSSANASPPAVVVVQAEPPVRRSERARSLPSVLADYQVPDHLTRAHARRLLLSVRRAGRNAVGSAYDDSPTLKQALSSPNAADWIAAIEKELDSLQALDAYEIVIDVPPGNHILPCHLVLRQKRFADGSPDKKKARLVAGGHRQPDHLYAETYSPTARPITVKIVLQIAAVQAYFIKCFDVGSAFLRSDIDKDIYIRIPAVGSRPAFTAKLKKSLYGLKQAGRLWYDEISATLRDFGCKQSAFDPCLFIKNYEDDGVMYIALHVDDMLVVSSDENQPNALKKFLEDRYKDITESDGSSHLGLRIDRDPDTGDIQITQPGLVAKILHELQLEPGKSHSVSVPSSDSAATSSADAAPCDRSAYATVLGMLLYLTHSRPDIMYAVSRLSANAHNPSQADWRALMRVGRYLLGTSDLGLHLRHGNGSLWAHAYVDASFAGHSDGRSHSGITLALAPHSGAIHSSSKKQTLVALSSTEAETEALKSFATLAAWLRPLLQELGYEDLGVKPVQTFEDNAATLFLAKSDGNWGRTRHFMVRYHYIRSKIEDHTIALTYVPTDEQVADIFTKSLDATTFARLRDYLLGIDRSQFIDNFLAADEI
jgi:hypothetical protein